MTFIATRRRFGRYVFAIGGNPEAAELSGINTRWTLMKVFGLMGLLCGISACISTARLNAATNAAGTLDELYVIASAVIGGTSLAGGIGTIAGAMLGALVMQSLQSGMVLLGVDTPLAEHRRRRGARAGGLGRQPLSPPHQVRRSACMPTNGTTPLVEMRNISIAFGGIKAVDGVSVDLRPGEVVGLLGHNGAGKSTLIKILSGAYKPDAGEIYVNGEHADISTPRDAKRYGIETIYQTLALADNIDAAGNIFLGREVLTPYGTLDDATMESETRKVMARLNPHFRRFKEPVKALSGGQRQSVAIARAIYFNARVLIMDEPTAALGPAETQQVADLVLQLKKEGIGIFLISHDIHDVFGLADRVSVMKNGKLVGSANVQDVTQDEVLGMIILGKCPPGATPGPARADCLGRRRSETDREAEIPQRPL